jgi:hypothetical protein
MSIMDTQPTVRLDIEIPRRRIGAYLQAQEQEIQAAVQTAFEQAVANYDYAGQVSAALNTELRNAIQRAVNEWLSSQPARTAINEAVATRLQAAIDNLHGEL